MSFGIMLLLAFGAGILGGIVHYLLPANSNGNNGYQRPLWKCLLLGIGATLLVPVFLELAQSKLMDNIRFDWKWTTDPPGAEAGKTYLLWTAYCIVAAAAGFQFIDMIIRKVVREEELKESKNKADRLEREKRLARLQAHRQGQQDERKALNKFSTQLQQIAVSTESSSGTSLPLQPLQIPLLPPVSNLEDPQKGRFGGLAENNGRRLKAEVSEIKGDAEFFNINFWVETTDPNKPLQGPVVFYVHDTFHPSVMTVLPGPEGRASCHLEGWGAFTIGALVDGGQTQLELDLAEDKSFPAKFRSR